MSTPARPPAAASATDRVRWPLVAVLVAVALTRPLLSITGLAEAWGKPATPILATVLITVAWVAVVVATRAPRPVETLLWTGVGYAAVVSVASGFLSVILDGELQGPLTHPFALVGVVAVNACWGLAAGVVARAIAERR